MSTMEPPVFHKSKTTTGILEFCEKKRKWDFISICYILSSEVDENEPNKGALV